MAQNVYAIPWQPSQNCHLQTPVLFLTFALRSDRAPRRVVCGCRPVFSWRRQAKLSGTHPERRNFLFGKNKPRLPPFTTCRFYNQPNPPPSRSIYDFFFDLAVRTAVSESSKVPIFGIYKPLYRLKNYPDFLYPFIIPVGDHHPQFPSLSAWKPSCIQPKVVNPLLLERTGILTGRRIFLIVPTRLPPVFQRIFLDRTGQQKTRYPLLEAGFQNLTGSPWII